MKVGHERGGIMCSKKKEGRFSHKQLSLWCHRAELANSVLAMAVTVASTHYIYHWRDGQAELTWVAWSNTKMVHLQRVTHFSTNLAQYKVLLMLQVITSYAAIGE